MAEQTVAQIQKSLNFTPKSQEDFDALTEKEQREILTRKGNEQEMNAARKTVKAWITTDAFKKLTDDIQSAVIRMAGKATGAGLVARPSIIKTVIAPMFPKKGTSVSELDIFMATKMGRGEFRKKVREALKGSDAADRLWIEFDEANESWVLLAKGGDQPKGWLGKDID